MNEIFEHAVQILEELFKLKGVWIIFLFSVKTNGSLTKFNITLLQQVWMSNRMKWQVNEKKNNLLKHTKFWL